MHYDKHQKLKKQHLCSCFFLSACLCCCKRESLGSSAEGSDKWAVFYWGWEFALALASSTWPGGRNWLRYRGSGLQTVHLPRFQSVGRVPSPSLACANVEKKVIYKLKCPPAPRSSTSFHSLINHPVRVLIHLHPATPLLIAPPPIVPDGCPILLAGLIQQSMLNVQ